MTKDKIRHGLFVAILLFALPALSQQLDSLANTPPDSKLIVAEDAPLDSLAIDVLETTAPEQIIDQDGVKDNTLTFTKTDDKKKYHLKDDPKVAEYDSLWMKELTATADLYDEMYNEVSQLDPEKPFKLDLNTDTLKVRLAKLNQKTPFNVEYNPSLENVIKSFLTRKRALMERMLTASQFYFPLFEQEFDNHDIPLEMKYLSIVESALNPRARSRVGATGLWQFMYGTGREMKLGVSSYVDERSDPIKSTKAACKYLNRLYRLYNDWDLALAAYNSGPGNVNKAIRRSGGYRNYWNIRRNLPRETAGYVPAFLATMYIFEYADEHGLRKKNAHRPYFETDTVRVKKMIKFEQISELVGVSMEELKMLNPSYKLNIIPFVDGKDYYLRLPKSAIGKFVNNEEAIYAHVTEEIKKMEKPLPQLVKADNKVRYRVRSGDYLGKIAERYGVGVSQIKRWNGLRSNNLRVGQRLTIFPRKAVTSATPSKKKVAASTTPKSFPPGTKVHTVQKGDSLWTISRQYPGITIDNLKKWNGLRSNKLQPGTKLKLCECSS
ncbi:MAG: LysM peptidoglycan-binding domain-containing protein [Aurantibacter sp.]